MKVLPPLSFEIWLTVRQRSKNFSDADTRGIACLRESSHLRVLCLQPSLPSPGPRPPCCWSACSSHPSLSGTSVTTLCFRGKYQEVPDTSTRRIWYTYLKVPDTIHLARSTRQQIPRCTSEEYVEVPDKSTRSTRYKYWNYLIQEQKYLTRIHRSTWYKFVDGPPTSASFLPSWVEVQLSWKLLHHFCHLGSTNTWKLKFLENWGFVDQDRHKFSGTYESHFE